MFTYVSSSLVELIWDLNPHGIKIRKGDEHDSCRNFPKTKVGKIASGDESTHVCVGVQIVTECSALATKGEWFVQGYFEGGAGTASFSCSRD